MRTVETLIDEAIKRASGVVALAKIIGKSHTQVADMRAGRLPISPETVGLLCNVLELDAEEARRLLAESIVNHPKNKARQGVLRRAFFVSLVAGGAAGLGIVLEILSGTQNSFTLLASVTPLTLYTLSIIRKSQAFRAIAWAALQWWTTWPARTVTAPRRCKA
jgi:hypothetical protein